MAEVIESPSAIICTLWDGTKKDRVAPLNERMANSRLIAAAPDMRDVLVEAVEVLDAAGIVYGDSENEPLDVLRKASALLARVEGR